MELKSILEAILFSSQKPLNVGELRDVLRKTADTTEEELPRALKKTSTDEIEGQLQTLAQEVEQLGRSFRLVCVAGAWQFVSLPEYSPWLRTLLGERARPPRLST